MLLQTVEATWSLSCRNILSTTVYTCINSTSIYIYIIIYVSVSDIFPKMGEYIHEKMHYCCIKVDAD